MLSRQPDPRCRTASGWSPELDALRRARAARERRRRSRSRRRRGWTGKPSSASWPDPPRSAAHRIACSCRPCSVARALRADGQRLGLKVQRGRIARNQPHRNCHREGSLKTDDTLDVRNAAAAFPAAKPLLRRAASSEQHEPASGVGFPIPTRPGASDVVAERRGLRRTHARRGLLPSLRLSRTPGISPWGGLGPRSTGRRGKWPFPTDPKKSIERIQMASSQAHRCGAVLSAFGISRVWPVARTLRWLPSRSTRAPRDVRLGGLDVLADIARRQPEQQLAQPEPGPWLFEHVVTGASSR